MWKRLNRPLEKAIGSPTLVETSLDEDSAAKLTDIDNMRDHGHSTLYASRTYDPSSAGSKSKKLPSVPLYVTSPAPRPVPDALLLRLLNSAQADRVSRA